MKYISKILLLSSLLITSLWSCKKDENQVFFTGGTEPVLKSSLASASSLTLTEPDKDLTAFVLSWTNPNYSFTTGVSSQNVSYTIEIDTTGANFTSPKKKEVSLSSDLSKGITIGELNSYAVADLGLKTGMNHNVELRVKSSLANAGVLYSNVIKYTINPYLVVKVALPSSGDLFLVGNASPGGWNNPVPVPSQKFTQVSATVYELTIALTGGNSYLLLPVNGSWSDKYGGAGSGNNSNNVNGDDFKRGGSDLLAPAASGNYKISVDFVSGKFTLTKL
jgi:hypothetical protein